MILYNKIKEFVKGHLFNKVQKENKLTLLMQGFVEGCYDLDDEYMNGSKIINYHKEGENIEDMVEDTENLLKGTRAY